LFYIESTWNTIYRDCIFTSFIIDKFHSLRKEWDNISLKLTPRGAGLLIKEAENSSHDYEIYSNPENDRVVRIIRNSQAFIFGTPTNQKVTYRFHLVDKKAMRDHFSWECNEKMMRHTKCAIPASCLVNDIEYDTEDKSTTSYTVKGTKMHGVEKKCILE
jgi:hypothetical protein